MCNNLILLSYRLQSVTSSVLFWKTIGIPIGSIYLFVVPQRTCRDDCRRVPAWVDGQPRILMIGKAIHQRPRPAQQCRIDGASCRNGNSIWCRTTSIPLDHLLARHMLTFVRSDHLPRLEHHLSRLLCGIPHKQPLAGPWNERRLDLELADTGQVEPAVLEANATPTCTSSSLFSLPLTLSRAQKPGKG
jgi:hypothetical protein